jgi:hypothetical protein
MSSCTSWDVSCSAAVLLPAAADSASRRPAALACAVGGDRAFGGADAGWSRTLGGRCTAGGSFTAKGGVLEAVGGFLLAGGLQGGVGQSG